MSDLDCTEHPAGHGGKAPATTFVVRLTANQIGGLRTALWRELSDHDRWMRAHRGIKAEGVAEYGDQLNAILRAVEAASLATESGAPKGRGGDR